MEKFKSSKIADPDHHIWLIQIFGAPVNAATSVDNPLINKKTCQYKNTLLLICQPSKYITINQPVTKSTNHTTVQSLKRNLFHPYLGNLDTPIQQQLGSNVVLVLMDIVEEAPMRHQLCDQLDGGTQADAQQADQVGVLHASHNQGLLNETEIHSGMRGKGLGMDDDTENSSQQILHSQLF